jgi:hypothetical protein
MARQVPRPFQYAWGKGEIIEEVSCVGEHHQPAIQLLVYEDGEESIRFCFYNLRGQFQRHPLMIGPEEIAQLRTSLKQAPRLRALMKQLVG